MKSAKKTSTIFITVIIIMVLLMTALVINLNKYVQRSIHDERKVYLSAQTEAVSGLIDSTLAQYLDYALICKQTITYELVENTDITSFMNEIQEKLYLKNSRLILVDSNGTWYGENGTSGRITAIENYRPDTADNLIYLTTGVDTNVESFVFKARLDHPVTVKKGAQSIEICDCSVIYYLDEFSENISKSFPYNCNSFVTDEDGLMLYKNFRMGILIGGSNIYSKYERVPFLYGDTGEELITAIRAGETTVAESVINNHNYFICSSPLSYNNWRATFVVDNDELAAGSYIKTIFRYISSIASVFAIAISVTGFAVLKITSGRKLIEKQQQANVFLEKASNAKSEFLSNISYNIRTPIHGIMGMTSLAKSEENSPKTQECLNKIEISSKYLLSLVNDVLDMSAIESGDLIITSEAMDLPLFAQNCVDIIHGQAQGRRLRIDTNFSNIEHEFVKADENHLKQIILNILSNAVKFTPDGGKISFRLDETQVIGNSAFYLFEISDNGQGMDQDTLDSLWDRSKRTDSGSRSNGNGTGLGMAITKKLIDAMNGTVEVKSEPGNGSRFIIQLSFEICEETEIVNKEYSSGIEGVKVLLAEDNDVNMEIACELLKGKGAMVTGAKNGKIALDTFANSPEHSFDIILMDTMMPEMDGLDSCKAIRALERDDAKNIPIIAMMANDLQEDIDNAVEAGMNAHIKKPINSNEIVNTIKTFQKGGN